MMSGRDFVSQILGLDHDATGVRHWTGLLRLPQGIPGWSQFHPPASSWCGPMTTGVRNWTGLLRLPQGMPVDHNCDNTIMHASLRFKITGLAYYTNETMRREKDLMLHLLSSSEDCTVAVLRVLR